MKKLLGLFLAFALLVALVPFNGFAQAQSITEINTPKDYINYLKSKVDASIAPNEVRSSTQVLHQFTSLSSQNQQKFVDYLNNPDVIKFILDNQGANAAGFGGDVKVTVNSHNNEEISLAANKYYRENEATSTVLGIDIIKSKVYIEWEVEDSKITKILNSGGLVTRNWWPFVDIKVTNDKPYISNNVAYQTSYFAWNFVHSKLGALIGTVTHKIWGYHDGRYDTSFSKS